MPKLKTIERMIRKPLLAIKPLGHTFILKWIPDEPYLKLLYYSEFKKVLNLSNPLLFTEKLQWLKIHNREPEYSKLVDKYCVREFVSSVIGEEYLTPIIAVYNNVGEIEWGNLPNEFVIKCNHGSGTNIICFDKKRLNIKLSSEKLKRWMKKNWYWFGREWPYKNLKKKIIVEQLLVDNKTRIPNDYKFWIFNNEIKFINVHFKEDNKTKINIYNNDWELQNFGMVYKNNLNVYHKKPVNYEKMSELAKKISAVVNSPFLRVDFYEVNGKIYFGEITFFPTSGLIHFHPYHEEIDLMYGTMLHI